MNNQEQQQIQQAWYMTNPENEIRYCPGGCNQVLPACLCKEMEEAKKQLNFKKDNTTVSTYGKQN